MNEKHEHPSFTTLGGSKIDVLGVFTGISHCKLTSCERFDTVIELELKAICRAICAKNARHLCFKINMRLVWEDEMKTSCLTLASSTTFGFITKGDCLFGIFSSSKSIENQCSSGFDVAAEMHVECVAFESTTETLCDFCDNPSIKAYKYDPRQCPKTNDAMKVCNVQRAESQKRQRSNVCQPWLPSKT